VGFNTPPDYILQPLGHGIHQVLQVKTHEVSISLMFPEFEIASSREIVVP
jgi:hypothetical protein